MSHLPGVYTKGPTYRPAVDDFRELTPRLPSTARYQPQEEPFSVSFVTPRVQPLPRQGIEDAGLEHRSRKANAARAAKAKAQAEAKAARKARPQRYGRIIPGSFRQRVIGLVLASSDWISGATIAKTLGGDVPRVTRSISCHDADPRIVRISTTAGYLYSAKALDLPPPIDPFIADLERVRDAITRDWEPRSAIAARLPDVDPQRVLTAIRRLVREGAASELRSKQGAPTWYRRRA